MTREQLLRRLPPDQDSWILVHPQQAVKDIINEILDAHSEFAPYYDKIALCFDDDTIEDVCKKLYSFCKNEITYREESEDDQTTALPTGILTRGYGDCKHYASFIGGVLDGLNRLTERKINWNYRFVSYELLNDSPHHVFIVVTDGGNEYWIDPTPGADEATPVWQIDKKIKKTDMALHRQIAGAPFNGYNGNTIGWSVDTSTGFTKSGPTMVPRVGHPFYGEDWLGLSRYGTPTNTDLNVLLQQLQALIDKGPAPYTLSRGMLDKVLRDNVENWNFYYSNGSSPTPRNWINYPPFKNYLSLTITQDGRLTFDRDEEPPHNWPDIHYMVDWVQYLVNKYSDEPYIVLIDHLKRLGKGWQTPQGGSLWHVIHSGDVNAVRFKDLIKKVPGLSQLIESTPYGKYLEVATNFAAGGGPASVNDAVLDSGAGIVPGQPATPGNTGIGTLLIAAAAAAAGYYFPKKNKVVIAAVAGIGTYFLLSRGHSATPATPVVPLPSTPAPPVTGQPTLPPGYTGPVAIKAEKDLTSPADYENPSNPIIDIWY